MKRLFLLFLLPALLAAQNVNVQKSGDGTNRITGNLVVGDGRSITATGTGQIVSTSGAATTVPWSGVTGTPTSLSGYGVTNGSYLDALGAGQATYLGFNTSTPGTGGVARLVWDTSYETLALGLNNEVTLQIGQETLIHALNNTGSPLTDGQLVYVTGAQGQRPTVALAQANSNVTADRVIGMVTESIPNGQMGFITISGIVNNVNTNGLADGTPLWLSPSVAGGYTGTQPVAPNHSVLIGYVVNGGSTGGGSILVNVRNGWDMNDLHDVLITAPVLSGSTLLYDATNSVWRNARLSAGTGITITNGDASSSIALTNNAITIAGTSTALGGSIARDTITGVSTNGVVARTATNTLAARAITGTAGQITVTNGDGVSGNPTISLPSKVGIGQAVENQATLSVANSSVAEDESASVTSTRLVTLTSNLTGVQHRVFDGGFHINMNGFSGTQVQGTYGGILVEGAGGGTLDEAQPLVAMLLTEDAVTVTNGQLIRASASIGAGTTVTNLAGLRVINSATDGTLTNFHGVDVDNFTAGTLTTAFRSRIASGTGKWGLYLDGTAANYVAGNLLVGTTSNPSNYRLNVGGTAGFSTDVVITGDLTLTGKFNNYSVRVAATPAGGTLGINVSGTVATNEGASARSDFTLPTASAGKTYTFYVQDSDGLRVTAAAGDTIRIAASVSAVAGYAESTTVGNSVTLVAINATEWVATSVVGTWTVN